MGGAWERLVVEAENMVNSRPLTYLPLESAEAEALTPKHFLLLSSNGVKQRDEGIVAVVQVKSKEPVRREILGRSCDHWTFF